MSVDVIIPVYRPDSKFERLIKMLLMQRKRPERIILLNTEVPPDFDTAAIRERAERVVSNLLIPGEGEVNIEIHSILPEEYDHGGTRAFGASLSKAEFLLFMTQDAVPKDEFLIEKLLEPFYDESVAAAYARQLAGKDADVLETYTRIFNYPENGSVKSKEDLNRLGIKTYFCSNVCAIYRRDVYEKLGGFVPRTIFNEDMIFASELIQNGYRVAYAANAKVIHSHNYTIREQFHRNFDLGVSHKEFEEIFKAVPSESEGVKLVKQTLAFLADRKDYLLMIRFMTECGAKYLGYFLGKHYSCIPKELVIRISMNKRYWRK